MLKIILCKGLPGSGKTTWSRHMVDKHPWVYKRVNKDDLRAMLDNSRWSKDNEKFVLELRDKAIQLAVSCWKNVIVDDTNFHTKHLQRMNEIASAFNESWMGVEVGVKEFDTPLKECIKRDLIRMNSVGSDVIKKMYNQYLKPNQEDIYMPDPTKPKAIIFDIDGTLAKMDGRSPYDYSEKLLTDKVKQEVKKLCSLYRKDWYIILLFSWRSSTGDQWTLERLRNNWIEWDYFRSRTEWDQSDDRIVKKTFFDEFKDKYNIEAVFDDRDRMVELWRDLGLQCFQVDYWDF